MLCNFFMAYIHSQTESRSRTFQCVFLIISAALFFFLKPATVYSEETIVCSACHRAKSEGKVIHPVMLTKGCVSCHTKPHSKKFKEQKFLFATGVELCFGCHDKALFSNKFNHPPVAQGMCTSCHDVHTSEHPKLLIAAMPDLCFMCHDKTKFVDTTTHPPVAQGKCTSCHDPHAGSVKKLLLAKVPDLCYRCHAKKSFSGKKSTHSPVRDGMCNACHAPHASSVGKLLLNETPDLCFGCHNRDELDGGKVVHKPVGEGMCMSCHLPHQGDADKLLLSKMPDLCFTCHDNGPFKKAKQHPPVAEGMCMECHKPHTARNKNLLPTSTNKVCFQCHQRVQQRPHIMNIGAKGHPVRAKNKKLSNGKKINLVCTSCHNPHSSDWGRLFAYPDDKLCSHCHEGP